MSFSTFSDAQPSIVVAAVPTPRTFRKSRRLTVAVGVWFSCSALILCLVVTRAAIVSRFEGRIRLTDVTVDAPSHVERRCLVYLLHVLDLSMTGLTCHSRVHVAHVWEVH